MGWGVLFNFRRNFNIHYIMKVVLDNCTDLTVELPSELLDFSEEQLKCKKDIAVMLESAGLKNYGEIGLPYPRT